MANSKPTKTSFNKDNQPKKGRGKSERTKILEAMERAGQTEEGFYDLLMEKAFNPEDNFTFKELLNRISPIPKAVAPLIKFDFDTGLSLEGQANQILSAMSKSEIPPDIGNSIIDGIYKIIKVKEVTDIDERLKKMEAEIESPE